MALNLRSQVSDLLLYSTLLTVMMENYIGIAFVTPYLIMSPFQWESSSLLNADTVLGSSKTVTVLTFDIPKEYRLAHKRICLYNWYRQQTFEHLISHCLVSRWYRPTWKQDWAKDGSLWHTAANTGPIWFVIAYWNLLSSSNEKIFYPLPNY